MTEFSRTHIVAIANQKGGVGKTTVTMHLGAVLSRRCRVLVVDVDPQRSTAWWAENARDRLPFDFAGYQSPAILAQLPELRAEYDFVLFDTPGGLEATPLLETVLDAADYVVVPMTPERLAVEPTARTVSRLIEPRRVRYGVLLNRINPRSPTQLRTFQHLLDTTFGIARFDGHLRQYQAHAEAPVLGQLVTTTPPTGRTAGYIADLTRVGYELSDQFSPLLAGVW
ncbi:MULTISPECIES: ParA family protein [unclassified Microbacterium]|uniref:ParA family protein n=1 Tax=unclassified Microbacterium TaxID=2609290 RepID=UPI00214B568C|nr:MULTISPECIES: ParA family protein [unclassified Microbacterium]MCR2811275.1 ParA family protein [Microbacterium sp. zg.B185]WIM19433.1 ParA family protein [Microbacterium sp. zg-B185]